MTNSTKDQSTSRRSFIKALVMSLFSFGTVAKLLISPKVAYAANCWIQVCSQNGPPNYPPCNNHVLYQCIPYRCVAIDQPSFTCQIKIECYNIGCC